MKFNAAKEYSGILLEDNNEPKIFYNIDIDVPTEKFRAKGDGTLDVPKEAAQKILTIEDVISYLVAQEVGTVKKNKNGDTDKEMLQQMLMGLTDTSARKFVGLEDSISFSFDYGNAMNDSVGMSVSKIKDSSTYSLLMKFNGNIQNSKFDKEIINKQIVFYSGNGETGLK